MVLTSIFKKKTILCTLTKFAAKNVNFLSQLFEERNLKPGDDLQLEHNLTNETNLTIF